MSTELIGAAAYYLVYLHWSDGRGVTKKCATFEAAMKQATDMVGSGYAKGHYEIRIRLVTHKTWRYKQN